MRYDDLPPEITELPQWVCVWNNSKIPMQAKTRKAASSTAPETWSTFDEAVRAVNDGVYDHIGFVFADNGIVGIDIDAGFDEDGFLSDLSLDCISHCQSYTELSRSGRGVHIFVKGSLPFKGKNNGTGVEIYRGSRYFITTGKKLIYPMIIENQQGIDYIVDKYFKDTPKDGESIGNSNNRIYTPKYEIQVEGKISITPRYPEIPAGMRNISLTSLAGQMHSQGYSKEQIHQELQKANAQACRPPLSGYEVECIVNSVTRYRR